jgi:hypothetical protein
MNEPKNEDWVIKGFLPIHETTKKFSHEEIEQLRPNLVTHINSLPIRRRYIDPPIENQKYGLLSFIPANGVTPNEQGFFGYVKLRGNFSTKMEVTEQENAIIRNVDSSNRIFTCLVGHPVPLVTSGFAAEKNEIDISKEVENDLSENVRRKTQEMHNEMRMREEREEELKRDVLEPNLEENHISKRQKLAVLRCVIDQNKLELEKNLKLREQCVKEIIRERVKNPSWGNDWMQRIFNAREKVGLSNTENLPHFMSYLSTPVVEASEQIDFSDVPEFQDFMKIQELDYSNTNSVDEKNVIVVDVDKDETIYEKDKNVIDEKSSKKKTTKRQKNQKTE